jgi:hypothetical protein
MKEKKPFLDLKKLSEDKYRTFFLFLSVISTVFIVVYAIYFFLTIFLSK